MATDANNALNNMGEGIGQFIRKPFSTSYDIATDPNKLQGILNVMVEGKIFFGEGGVKSKSKIKIENQPAESVPKTTKKIQANEGKAKPHGAFMHNKLIDEFIEQIKTKGATQIRKNQAQVDYAGNTVGYNRPDIQFNLNGKKYNIEIDTEVSSSFKHQKTIPLGDKNSVNMFFVIQAGKLFKAPKVPKSAPRLP